MGPSSALADLLCNDPNAIAAWSGEKAFTATDGTFSINAAVDFAVYAPGKFNTTFGGADPSGGTEYVYAYQIFNVTDPASEEITKISVGLLPLSGAHNIGVLTSPPVLGGGIVPDLYRLSGGSARWNFDDPTIAYGDHTAVFFFTSPDAPEWLAASVQDGLAASGLLPSPMPVPEPTTLALLLLGGAFGTRGWYRRRRTAR
jgi:hypothetical protein